jgi:tetratricopeptide (TPR) repeat protein
MSILLMAGFVVNAGYVASAQADNEDFKLSVVAETEREWNEFRDAMWGERTPTIEEMLGAWERAGKPDGFRIITLASEAIDSTGEPEQFGVIALTYDECEQYGWFRPTTAQIDWAFRDTATITPEEQLKIWAEEYEAKIAQEEATVRFNRMDELERLLVTEATEYEPDIVYRVVDGGAIQLQNDERSVEDCNKAIELNPNGADAYNYRGVAYADLKQYERAIEDFNKTIEFDPKNADAHNNRGVAYCFLGHYERAIEDFNKAMELNPNFIMAYSNRELALSKLEEKNSIPGFEAVFAITGFLAMVHLSRRRK